MNKADLIGKVADLVETQKQAKEVVETIIDAVSAALASDESVQIAGFGTFKVSQRKARTGRNPQTGAPIQIPASKVPRFTAAKALKEMVK